MKLQSIWSKCMVENERSHTLWAVMCCAVECHGMMLQAAGGALSLREALRWAAQDVPLRAARTESAPGGPARGPPPAPRAWGRQHTCREEAVPGGRGSCHTIPSQHPGLHLQCQHHDSRGEAKGTRQRMLFACSLLSLLVYQEISFIWNQMALSFYQLSFYISLFSACVAIICQSFIYITISMSVNEVCFTCLSSLCLHFLPCLCHESWRGTSGRCSHCVFLILLTAQQTDGASAPPPSPSPSLPQDCPVVHVSSRNIDMELVFWLQSLNIDRDVIDKASVYWIHKTTLTTSWKG